MRHGTDRKSGKTGAILSAVVVIGFLSVYLAVFLYPLLRGACGELLAAVIMAVYALAILAVMIGVVAALRQRLREIDGGEEADARKY